MSESKTSPPTPAFRSSLEGLEPLKNPSSLSVYENWALGELSAGEKDEIQANYEKSLIDNLEKNQRSSGLHLFHLADVLPTFTEGLQTLVDDSFTKCFSSHKYVNWNWNIYLFPVWLVGLFVRYCVLFPLRLLCLIAGSSIVFGLFPLVSILAPGRAAREKYQSYLVRLFATTFVASWSGVIRYHGVPPKRAPDQIYVANHTSLIDVVILEQSQAFSIVGQKHIGPVGFLQDYVLGCLGCLWFERNEQKDRLAVSRRIKEHIKDTKKNPLLIFPEGTCVNNEYCVMFKRGAFELGGSVIPIAIKYNKIFSNPHWNSKKESFQWHLFRLMTSWAVVCDVYYMKPQTPLRDESPAAFANRVKELICKKAGLTPVPWDGYLKHVRPSARFVELRQKAFAASLTKRSSSTNLAAMASDDGERDAKIREANSGLRDANSSDSDMGPRRRSHVNFDELLTIKPEAAPSQDGATSPKKGAPEAKPVKSD